MKPNKIAVTGATGQVGAALVRRLHDEGWHVVAATRNALGAALMHASVPDCDIRIGSLARTDGKHLLDDCDIVLNCAIAGSGGNPRQAYLRNRALVDGLLEAKSLRWLIHFSTVAIFGELIRAFDSSRRSIGRNPVASTAAPSSLSSATPRGKAKSAVSSPPCSAWGTSMVPESGAHARSLSSRAIRAFDSRSMGGSLRMAFTSIASVIRS